jgi:hypothetical protein
VSCRERRDAIFLYAAGALEDDERREIAAHLETGCPRCADALSEASAALAQLVESLDRVAPPEGSKERLLARIAAASIPALPRGPALAARRAKGATGADRRAALVAGVGLLLGASVSAALAWRLAVAPLQAERAALEQALGAATAELAEQDSEMHALEADARHAAEQLRLLRASDLEVMELTGAMSEREASGRIFWERDDYRCYFHAERMAVPAPGRTYVLWVVSARGEFFAVASFAPDARGEVALLTKLPKGLSPIARSLVTDEPSEHGERPTGSVHLRGGATKARAETAS